MSHPSGRVTRRCAALKSSGEPCGKWPIAGATVCASHGARAPQVRQRAAVRAELQAWRLDDATEDPGEVLLRLVTQSARRAALYGSLLERAYDAAERLAATEGVDHAATSGVDADAARDLEAVLATGGVGVLVGKTWGAAGKDGDIYATGEAIRGLAALEAQERERCAKFAALAISAGLEERRVRIAERLGDAVLALCEGLARALGFDPADPEVRRIVEAELVRIDGGTT